MRVVSYSLWIMHLTDRCLDETGNCPNNHNATTFESDLTRLVQVSQLGVAQKFVACKPFTDEYETRCGSSQRILKPSPSNLNFSGSDFEKSTVEMLDQDRGRRGLTSC